MTSEAKKKYEFAINNDKYPMTLITDGSAWCDTFYNNYLINCDYKIKWDPIVKNADGTDSKLCCEKDDFIKFEWEDEKRPAILSKPVGPCIPFCGVHVNDQLVHVADGTIHFLSKESSFEQSRKKNGMNYDEVHTKKFCSYYRNLTVIFKYTDGYLIPERCAISKSSFS